MAINWINMNKTPIPDYVYTNRVRLLLEDEDGFIGVGYWDSYSWVLDVPGYGFKHDATAVFERIERYAFLD